MGFYRTNCGRTFGSLTPKDLGGLKGALYFRNRACFYRYDAASDTVRVGGSSRPIYVNELPDTDYRDLQSSVLTGGFAPRGDRGDPLKFKKYVSGRFDQKLMKLNSHYRTFDRNILYIYTDPPRGGADGCVRSVAELVCASQKNSIAKFHSICPGCTDSLYVADPAGGMVERHDLGRPAQKRRMISTAMTEQYWTGGEPFFVGPA